MSATPHEQRWLEAARRGDRTAVTKLLARWHPVLRARAAAGMRPALRGRLAPEDILQLVYVEVFRTIDRFEEGGPDAFLNWCLTILDHKLVDAWREAHRRRRDVVRERALYASAGSDSYVSLLDEVHAHTGTPSRIVRREEAVGALLACLTRLPAPHADVLRLRFLQGLPVAEVAARLGKTEAAVVALTRRALDALGRSMNRLGEFTRA